MTELPSGLNKGINLLLIMMGCLVCVVTISVFWISVVAISTVKTREAVNKLQKSVDKAGRVLEKVRENR